MLWQEGGGEPPTASLGWAIDKHFGSLEVLIQRVNAEGAALQGSGWVVIFQSFFLQLCYNQFLFVLNEIHNFIN
jgi:superoxide dismutase